jgi:hypothetical protein
LARAQRAARATEAPAGAAARILVSFRIPLDLHNRLQNAVDALSGPPERLKIINVAQTALEREVERLEKKHNGGKPFPQRP